MKRVLIINLTLLITLVLLTGCVSQSDYEDLKIQNSILLAENINTREECDSVKNNYTTLESEFTVLRTEYAASEKTGEELAIANSQLQDEYISLQTELQQKQEELNRSKTQTIQLNENITTLNNRVTQLETDYNSLLEGTRQSTSTLKNPTWLELKQFLESDDTNTRMYVADQFDCSGFAITLRDRAQQHGFRCAFVEIAFGDEAGHALNAFQTQDNGLIYVDDTEHDTIAYIEIGQEYGNITIDAVKTQFFEKPDQFPDQPLTSLSLHSYDGNLFSYTYYANYQARVQFYRASSDAYNNAVQIYDQQNSGYSYNQLSTWYSNLNMWEEDLGSSFFNPMETVLSIEVYWN